VLRGSQRWYSSAGWAAEPARPGRAHHDGIGFVPDQRGHVLGGQGHEIPSDWSAPAGTVKRVKPGYHVCTFAAGQAGLPSELTAR
jgi:hypothetical protein